MATLRQTRRIAKKKKRNSAAKKTAEIGPRSTISEIVTLYPKAEEILAAYGLFCQHCVLSGIDTLEEGASLHGLGSEDMENLIDDLNEMLSEESAKPKKISITAAAAAALKGIVSQEKKIGQFLRVTVDQAGKFCMEFETSSKKGDFKFSHSSAPDLTLVASPLTMGKIGGSKIDFRKGKFVLDLDHECKNCEDCDCD